ncbi:MAG: extracellular solute-binding protein [Parcubacteria group bacterium]|nr:extracellular solute-binding protein [Parcubacteria group bacterium]
MKQTYFHRLGIGVLAFSLMLMGASCRKGGSLDAQRAYAPVTLEYWTVFNSSEDFTDVLADYQAIHPNIRINVKKFRFDEYEDLLVNALAEDRGPDIFSVHNTQVPAYRTKLMPLPPVTSLAYQTTSGSIKKETVTELRNTRSLNEFDLRSQFVEQVYKDVYLPQLTLKEDERPEVGDKVIYALPMALDTMVLYYNRDLLDNAGIAQAAKTWSEFQEHTGRLARFDSQGNILLGAAAMGTADNVPRAVDILTLLMMQNGAEMVTANGEVTFQRIPDGLRGQRTTIPAEDALRFYASFANPNQRTYTWNDKQIDGFQAFLQGKIAYFFGYAYHLEQIRGLAPKLNFGISSMPQIQGNPEVNFANYWVEGVSRKTPHVDAAWDFLQFATSGPEAQKFLAKAKRPAARRDLIQPQLDDPDLVIFGSQVLRAKSWYNGQDAGAMEGVMKALIRDALAGTADFDDLLKLAAERVQQTLRL